MSFFTSNEFQTVFEALNVGFLKTLQLFFITLIGSLPLGLFISLGSMNRWTPFRFLTHWAEQHRYTKAKAFFLWFRPLSLLCKLVVWLIRGTPLILQIIALFYVPGILKIFTWGSGEDGRMTAVCIAFVFNYACYFSEIFRGGIEGIPVGQQEAGKVLGMTRPQIFFQVTLLQMIKRIVPPVSNEIITLVKDTSLARAVSLQEVIWVAESFMKGGAGGYSGLIWPLFFTAVYYLIFSGVVTLLLNRLEQKLSYFH